MRLSFKQHTIILSLLLHFLFFSSAVIIWQPVLVFEKKPAPFVPSYAYEEPPPASSSKSYQEEAVQTAKAASETMPMKQVEKPTTTEKAIQTQPSISKAVQLKHASMAKTSSTTHVSDAIHLVGDKKAVPPPLIMLMGKALGKTIKYPKIAQDFRLRGTAYVGFNLHPDGSITELEIVQSSGAGVLDTAALAAVRAITPLAGVGPYVLETKPMVIGIIFN